MAVLIEDALPVVKHNGLNTAKAVTMGSTLAVTGASTLTGGVAGAIAATGAVSGTTISGTGIVTAVSGTAPAAGGTKYVQLGTAAGPTLCAGSGAPTIAATRGSLYVRTDAAATDTRLYINSDGDTTWTVFAAAA